MDKKDLKNLLVAHKIDVLRICFTDVQGRLKGLNIATNEVDKAVDEGIAFDGSSIDGFARIEESDLVAMPDLTSFRLFPFESGGTRSALVFCDILHPNGAPLESDPRRVLARALMRARSMGFDHYFVGPELEYFYFPNSQAPTPLDQTGYFDILPLDATAQARDRTLAVLAGMGMVMEATHHEVAVSQHEIDFQYADALKMADQIVLAKLVIKQVAAEHGLYASFMPKPIQGQNGSGMHVHQSLFKGNTNAFYSPDAPYNLSDTGRAYLAGLLAHAREMTAITNPTVNSFKRLVPGYEAPAYISWGRKNRSALVRVPAFKSGKGSSCRLEYRTPDPSANPYLAFAVMLHAGLEGIEKGLVPPEAAEQNLFHLSESQKAELGIVTLPGDLLTATREAEASPLVRKALGDALFETYLLNKKDEWERYRISVTDYELKTYLPIL